MGLENSLIYLPNDPLVEFKTPAYYPRCVVVNGQVCTGSSSLSKELANQLGFGLFETGRIIRKASKMWCNGSWENFLLNNKESFFAKTVDKIQNRSKVVVEGRLVAIQAQNAENVIRILCTASDEEILKRFDLRERLKGVDVESAYRERLGRDKAILEEIWGYPVSKLFDPKLYDVIVNTTNFTSVEITREIITRLV